MRTFLRASWTSRHDKLPQAPESCQQNKTRDSQTPSKPPSPLMSHGFCADVLIANPLIDAPRMPFFAMRDDRHERRHACSKSVAKNLAGFVPQHRVGGDGGEGELEETAQCGEAEGI